MPIFSFFNLLIKITIFVSSSWYRMKDKSLDYNKSAKNKLKSKSFLNI